MSAKAMYFFFNSTNTFNKKEEEENALRILEIKEFSNENTIMIHDLMKKKSKERINSFLYDQVGYYLFDCCWLFWYVPLVSFHSE